MRPSAVRPSPFGTTSRAWSLSSPDRCSACLEAMPQQRVAQCCLVGCVEWAAAGVFLLARRAAPADSPASA